MRKGLKRGVGFVLDWSVATLRREEGGTWRLSRQEGRRSRSRSRGRRGSRRKRGKRKEGKGEE